MFSTQTCRPAAHHRSRASTNQCTDTHTHKHDVGLYCKRSLKTVINDTTGIDKWHDFRCNACMSFNSEYNVEIWWYFILKYERFSSKTAKLRYSQHSQRWSITIFLPPLFCTLVLIQCSCAGHVLALIPRDEIWNGWVNHNVLRLQA